MITQLAQFRHLGSNAGDDWVVFWSKAMMDPNGTLRGYIRVSKWVEIDFPPRADEGAIAEELGQLDAKLEELKAEFTKKATAIEIAKQNLLALTDQREVFVDHNGGEEYST